MYIKIVYTIFYGNFVAFSCRTVSRGLLFNIMIYADNESTLLLLQQQEIVNVYR